MPGTPPRPPRWPPAPDRPRRAARRRAASLTLGVAVLLVTSGLLLALAPAHPEPLPDQPRSAGFDWTARRPPRPNPNLLAIGVTHGQYSIDDWGDDDARASAMRVLGATATYQNQHIFGWGALNPQPRPGVYEWTSLDRRMRLVRYTGGTPVITLCCAPDWMKGGRPGETDWTRLHAAPRPEHYRDFAQLAVAVAKRYPQVRHFLVWNEMKGFWDNLQNRWDYEAYTRFYNIVYDALKKAVPGVKVGGPYVVVDVWGDPTAGGRPSMLAGGCGTVDRRSLDVIDYWLRNKHGADFLAVDGGVVTRDSGQVASTTVATAMFGAVTRWLRQRTDLPIWWSEFHVGYAEMLGQQQLVAGAVAALLHMTDERAAVALVWQPERLAEQEYRGPPTLWTSTQSAGGGRPLPLAEALAWMQRLLADPEPADAVSWPVPEVGVLHGRHGLLVVSTAGRSVEVRVRGLHLRLAPYEVRYAPLPDTAPPPAPAWWTPALDECLSEQAKPAS